MILIALGLVLMALAGSGCSTSKYSETIDPATGMVIGRELRIGHNVNVLTSGDLSNAAESGGGLLGGLLGGGGGGRSSVASQTAAVAFADPSRPTIRSGQFEFYGTMERTSVIAAQGRSATGMLAETRRGLTRWGGIQAIESDRAAGHATDQAKVAAGVRETEIGGRVQEAQINSNQAIRLAEIEAEAAP